MQVSRRTGTGGASPEAMRLHQLRFSSKTRFPLFPDEAHRRAAVQRLAAAAQGKLVSFGFVDEHGHSVVVEDDGHIGRLGRSVGAALGAVAAEPLEPVWHEPVENRAHLKAAVRYQLNRPVKHGVPTHPALWSGSCFPDLLGARVIDGLKLRLFEVLPRLVPEDLLPMVGLRAGAVRAASDATIRGLGALRVKHAAASAFAAQPGLEGTSGIVVRARRVVAELSRDAGIGTGEVIWALGVTRSGLSRLGQHNVEDAWVLAVRLRLTLEETVQAEIERDWCRRFIREQQQSTLR